MKGNIPPPAEWRDAWAALFEGVSLRKEDARVQDKKSSWLFQLPRQGGTAAAASGAAGPPVPPLPTPPGPAVVCRPYRRAPACRRTLRFCHT